jgi:hypothetical protein
MIGKYILILELILNISFINSKKITRIDTKIKLMFSVLEKYSEGFKTISELKALPS